MITYDKLQLDQPSIDKLRTLFASPEYALLKSVIGARATERSIQFANASLYRRVRKEGSWADADQDNAEMHAVNAREKAEVYTHALDVLDEIEANPQWFHLKLDQRR